MADRDSPSRVAFYAELSQIGFEMAVPIGVGAVLDHWLGWQPWATVVGALVGLIGGLFHLVVMVNREPSESADQER
jgi:F0F1-type ATP synthase assembly protein I